MAAGHKEYCRPVGRKDDPSFDMVAFRVDVAKIMGQAVVPIVKPRTGTITIDGLNVRSNASVASTIVDVLNKGAIVDVSSEIMNGPTTWLKVAQGYVSAQFVDQTA